MTLQDEILLSKRLIDGTHVSSADNKRLNDPVFVAIRHFHHYIYIYDQVVRTDENASKMFYSDLEQHVSEHVCTLEWMNRRLNNNLSVWKQVKFSKCTLSNFQDVVK